MLLQSRWTQVEDAVKEDNPERPTQLFLLLGKCLPDTDQGKFWARDPLSATKCLPVTHQDLTVQGHEHLTGISSVTDIKYVARKPLVGFWIEEMGNTHALQNSPRRVPLEDPCCEGPHALFHRILLRSGFLHTDDRQEQVPREVEPIA